MRYLRRRTGHLALVAMSTAINMCLVPAFSLLPLLVLEDLRGDAFLLGWMSSILGAGIIAGGILLGIWGGFRRRILTTLWALVGLGAAVLALGLAPASSPVMALGAMLAVGLMVPSINGTAQAILQATVRPDFQGRVFTLMGSLAGVMAPVGLLLAAPVADLLGVRVWYVTSGLVCVAMGALGFLVPAILRIEETDLVEDSPAMGATLSPATSAGQSRSTG
jgi:DHA3 family macrolide efflux protein-like MFS transporter